MHVEENNNLKNFNYVPKEENLTSKSIALNCEH